MLHQCGFETEDACGYTTVSLKDCQSFQSYWFWKGFWIGMMKDIFYINNLLNHNDQVSNWWWRSSWKTKHSISVVLYLYRGKCGFAKKTKTYFCKYFRLSIVVVIYSILYCFIAIGESLDLQLNGTTQMAQNWAATNFSTSAMMIPKTPRGRFSFALRVRSNFSNVSMNQTPS